MSNQALSAYLSALYADANLLMHAINAGEIAPILEANAAVRAAVEAMPRKINKLPKGEMRDDLATLEAVAVEQYEGFQPHLDAALADGEWKDESAAVDTARILQAVVRVSISEFAGKHGLNLNPDGGMIPTAAQIAARELAE